MKILLFTQLNKVIVVRAMAFLFICLLGTSPVLSEVYNVAGINYSYIPYSGTANVASGANGVAGSTVSGDVTILSTLTINNREYIVKGIKQYAFLNNSGLRNITIPETIEEIYHDAFYGCSKLQHAYMGGGLKSIGDRCFYGCTNINEIELPSSVTTIGKNAFYQCMSLTDISIPKGVTIINEQTFSRCTKLQNVKLNNVESIGNQSFRYCSALKQIVLPECLTTIGSNAFNGSGLNNITIPASVSTIGEYAFSDCNGLRTVTSLSESPIAISSTVFYQSNNESKFTSAILYVPKGCKEKYQSTEGWNKFEKIVEIGGSTIEPLSEPQEVDMKNSVPSNVDLLGTVIGNTYYVLDSENGEGIDSENGSIIINTPTSNEAINGIVGKEISDESIKDVFKGIIFMVPSGNGLINITAESTGENSLVVKVGSNEAQVFKPIGKETMTVSYNAETASYVYVYAGTSAQLAKKKSAMRVATTGNSVKIYSYKWEPTEATGINLLDNTSVSYTPNIQGVKGIYTLTGVKVTDDATDVKALPRGIYIVNGKKVAIK